MLSNSKIIELLHKYFMRSYHVVVVVLIIIFCVCG